jgi:hypothetical protein
MRNDKYNASSITSLYEYSASALACDLAVPNSNGMPSFRSDLMYSYNVVGAYAGAIT